VYGVGKKGEGSHACVDPVGFRYGAGQSMRMRRSS